MQSLENYNDTPPAPAAIFRLLLTLKSKIALGSDVNMI